MQCETPKEKDIKPQSSCKSLARGLKIIDILGNYPNGCPLAKISQDAGFNKSTVHRLLQELIINGYVQPCATQGNYRLTTKLLVIGHHVVSSTNIYNLISPYLEKLNLAFSETVNFSMIDDDHAIMLLKLNPTNSILKTKTSIGQILPLYCTAMGKVYLAFSSDENIENYWQTHLSNIIKITDKTIVNFVDFQKEIEKVRQSYVAFDNEENELGISCIAAPIFDINYVNNYAISLSATTKKLNTIGFDKVQSLLLETCKNISSELGCENYFALKKDFD